MPPFPPPRTASQIPTPPHPLTHRWRCCTTHCTSTNSYTSPTHFISQFSPQERQVVLVPGYLGQECAACRHPACETCLFLEVRRARGEVDEGKNAGNEEQVEHADEDEARRPWISVGLWDPKSEFKEGGVPGLRTTDELPPGNIKKLGEAWRGNGRMGM